jgi:hypothetical protein
MDFGILELDARDAQLVALDLTRAVSRLKLRNPSTRMIPTINAVMTHGMEWDAVDVLLLYISGPLCFPFIMTIGATTTTKT